MSNIRRCDGCMTELDVDDRIGQRARTCIEGRRVDGLSGVLNANGMLVRDGEEFHWCMNCTRIAFKAVDDAATSGG